MADRDLHNKVEAINAAIAGGGFESMLQLQIDIMSAIHEYQAIKRAQVALRRTNKDSYAKTSANYAALAEQYVNSSAPKLMADLRKFYASMTISLNRLRAAIDPKPHDVWARTAYAAAHAAEESSDSDNSDSEQSDSEQSASENSSDDDDMKIVNL